MKTTALLLLLLTSTLAPAQEASPQPRVVTPGPLPHQPPSDATILFDGHDTSAWTYSDNRPAQWPVIDGILTSKSGTGNIYSKIKFTNAQIHVEFATPNMPTAKGQAKGNSGVYLQGRYEIQILDSFNNPTYANGSAGALYGQYAPLVNASRPPTQWQSYDIIFHGPRCYDPSNHVVTTPGTVTVLHNGVLVQDHSKILGRTTSSDDTDPCAPGPLMLQDHFHPDVKETFMQFRNIWLRILPD